MILFLGTRRRRRLLGTGAFRCPYCVEPRRYERAEVRTWFLLFWIPLVPLGSAREEIHCTVCGGTWAPAVLQGAELG